MQPFNEETPKEFPVSFSTGFISRKRDGVNPEETIDVGNTMPKKLDGKLPSTTVERKSKIQPLANLRKLVSGSEGAAPINALKYFNRLVLFAQREDNLESSLGFYELTPIPMLLFSKKDQLMHKGDKATFAKLCLKDKIDLTNNNQDIDIDTVVIDGGWLLRQCTWAKGDKWRNIKYKYCTRVKYLGRSANNAVVVFDGYENSTKDHTHRRRQKQFCHDIKIREDMIPYTTKEKFISNSSNKSALVSMISTKLSSSNISSICCRDDADTTIVKESLQYSLLGNVGVVAEDADILIILIHHLDINIHKEIRILASKGHYRVNEIVNNLTPDEKLCILFCHSFSGCDTVSSIFCVSKEKFHQKICSGQLRQITDKLYCDTASTEDIGNAGILIFQFIYNMPATSLSIQRLCKYIKLAKTGVIHPASLPPANGSAIQHSLREYLQIQDWILLKSMPRDWYVTSPGQFESIMTLGDIAPANCTTKRCSCKKNNVKCISACGGCYDILCKNNEVEVPLPESD